MEDFKFMIGDKVEKRDTGHIGIITDRRRERSGDYYRVSTYPTLIAGRKLENVR